MSNVLFGNDVDRTSEEEVTEGLSTTSVITLSQVMTAAICKEPLPEEFQILSRQNGHCQVMLDIVMPRREGVYTTLGTLIIEVDHPMEPDRIRFFCYGSPKLYGHFDAVASAVKNV